MASILDATEDTIELIKNTVEYRNYIRAKETLEMDIDLKNKYLEYRNILTNIYLENKCNEDVEVEDSLYILYESLMSNPISKEYMIYEEMLFSVYNEVKNKFLNNIEFLK